MSVRRCQEEVDSAEFTGWMGYSQIEHFGPQMDDLRMGNIAAALYNVHRDTKKQRDPFGPADVFPWMREKAESDGVVTIEDPAEQKAALRALLFGNRLKVKRGAKA